MATHTVHPDVAEHGLADDCPRCAELAERPLELDDDNLRSLWQRMLDVEFGEPGERDSYRSANEATAGRWLYHIALFLQRYTPLDPRELPERWDSLAAWSEAQASR